MTNADKNESCDKERVFSMQKILLLTLHEKNIINFNQYKSAVSLLEKNFKLH